MVESRHLDKTVTREKTVARKVVQDYLDFMLQDTFAAPEQAPEQEQAQEKPVEVPPTLELVQALAAKPEPAAEPAPKPEAKPETPVAKLDETPAISVQTAEPLAAEQAEEAATASAKPAWGEQDFAALLFDVQGMSMAAPLVTLGGIVKLGDSLRPVAGQADWFMGLMRWNGRTLRVADSAALLMPEQAARQGSDRKSTGDARNRGYDCVVVLDNSDWALAVDVAEESQRIRAEDVRWRKQRGQRQWLAGTVSGKLCALLDPDVIARRLNATENKG